MRKFIIFAAAVAMFASCCNQPAEPVKKEIGIQLYSVRDIIGNYADNHEELFAKLVELGYTCVETCGYNNGTFYGVAPEQYKADLEAAGLKAISTHTMCGLTDEEVAAHDFSAKTDWWKKCIAAHKAIGCRYIVAPGFSIPNTLEGLKTYCDYFNEIGKMCAEEGMKFGYHNHSHEFNSLEGEVIYDFMLQNTDPELVFFEMDVYWTVMAKQAPVNYFKKYPGRFTCLHIKDYREVGQSGMVGFDAIFNAAEISGMKDFVVEMEGSSYGDIIRTCQESADYLKAADFVKPCYGGGCCCTEKCGEEKECCGKCCDKK